MKKNISIMGKWIAEWVRMGHASTARLAIKRFARANSRNTKRIREKPMEAYIEKNAQNITDRRLFEGELDCSIHNDIKNRNGKEFQEGEE